MTHAAAVTVLTLGSAFVVLAEGGVTGAARITAGAQAPGIVRVDASREAMGTTFAVEAHGGRRERLERTVADALDEASRIDRLLSNYDASSEWSRVNREAGRRPVVVSRELFELLAACMTYHADTDKAFDISVGPLMKVWGFYKDEGVLPAPGEVTRALARVGSRHVRLDRAARTVEFLTDGVELDPGGIGKGYAIDRMVSILKRDGVNRAFLSAGGSTIYGLGRPPDDPRGWAARIRDPRLRGRAAAEVFLRDMSLSTSGSYEKFFRADGRVYSHIMDPRTGFPARGVSAVSVLSPRAIDSEAWTKAYFVNGLAWTRANRRPGMRVLLCDDTDAAACQWVE